MFLANADALGPIEPDTWHGQVVRIAAELLTEPITLFVFVAAAAASIMAVYVHRARGRRHA